MKFDQTIEKRIAETICPDCAIAARAIVQAAITTAASEMGRKGGSAKSARKTAAVRINAKKGGWPKGRPRKVTK